MTTTTAMVAVELTEDIAVPERVLCARLLRTFGIPADLLVVGAVMDLAVPVQVLPDPKKKGGKPYQSNSNRFLFRVRLKLGSSIPGMLLQQRLLIRQAA